MMKKIVLLIILLVGIGSSYAIDYPTYKPARRQQQTEVRQIQSAELRDASQSKYAGYSTVATGGTTTSGEGSAIRSVGPRKAPPSGSYNTGDWYTEGGQYWVWNGSGWDGPSAYKPISATGQQVNPGTPGEGSPIGDAILPLLLMALMASVVVYFRQKKAQN